MSKYLVKGTKAFNNALFKKAVVKSTLDMNGFVLDITQSTKTIFNSKKE